MTATFGALAAARVDLSADLGETIGDLALLELITSASVACGGHSGDRSTMARAAAGTVSHGVVLGAHPGYADQEGFGRRELNLAPEVVSEQVMSQISTLQELAAGEGAAVRYVKLHGALYHRANGEHELAGRIVEGIVALGLAAVLAPQGSALALAGASAGLLVAAEGFCDRAYRADGSLADRSEPGAVLDDQARITAQALAIATGRAVETLEGEPLLVEAASLCLHGDGPHALAHARAVQRALRGGGVELAPFVPATATAPTGTGAGQLPR